MEEGLRRFLDALEIRSPASTRESNDAAQAVLLPPGKTLHGSKTRMPRLARYTLSPIRQASDDG